MSDFEQYATSFPIGMKIGVGIPMDNNELFRDWAIIHGLEEDMVTLQLSRDDLPVEVHLHPGSMLELRGGKDNQGYRCSASFIAKGEIGEIIAQLTGDVTSSELREFFRIDAFLPFTWQFSKDQHLDTLIAEWRSRKQHRLEDEAERKEEILKKRRELVFRTAAGEFNTEGREPEKIAEQDDEELELIDKSWNSVNASAVNLSGGGFKFVTADHFQMDEVIFLEVFIPASPPRIMDSVAKVVFKNRNLSIKGDREYYNVALHFMLIDERDRDAIISHISNLELLRIRQSRQIPLISDNDVKGRIPALRLAGVIVALLGLLLLISLYLYGYSQNNENNEIQDMFQNAVRKYRENTGR